MGENMKKKTEELVISSPQHLLDVRAVNQFSAEIESSALARSTQEPLLIIQDAPSDTPREQARDDLALIFNALMNFQRVIAAMRHQSQAAHFCSYSQSCFDLTFEIALACHLRLCFSSERRSSDFRPGCS